MKKAILAVVLTLTLILCLVGCGIDEEPLIPGGPSGDEILYKLTMNNPFWLYEKLDGEYSAGELVSVKILYDPYHTDTGYIFFLNREKVEISSVNETYLEFSFNMPNRNSVIDFKTYDMKYGALIESFWLQNPSAEYVTVSYYYGEYESGAVVAMLDWCAYTANEWSEEVAGSVFRYGSGNRIQVLYNNEFLTLPQAYEIGALSSDDIAKIEEKHNYFHFTLATPIYN